MRHLVTMHDTSTCSDLPSGELLDLFEERMRDIWRRGNFGLSDLNGTARLIRILLEREGFKATANVLAESGIRANWNLVFAEERSRFLADWLLPYLDGRTLDILGGDFTVLRALTDAGLDATSVAGCERLGVYNVDWAALPFPVHDFGAELALPPQRFDTYLVCTVLHHEPDLDAFLAALDPGARRWVVVENCVDSENPDSFHLFIDEFFNKCLNSFDVPCVRQHRTADEWRHLLGQYGRISHEETRCNVPGMPFPYTLIVIDR